MWFYIGEEWVGSVRFGMAQRWEQKAWPGNNGAEVSAGSVGRRWVGTASERGN